MILLINIGQSQANCNHVPCSSSPLGDHPTDNQLTAWFTATPEIL